MFYHRQMSSAVSDVSDGMHIEDLCNPLNLRDAILFIKYA